MQQAFPAKFSPQTRENPARQKPGKAAREALRQQRASGGAGKTHERMRMISIKTRVEATNHGRTARVSTQIRHRRL
jgi:hypothetical protein